MLIDVVMPQLGESVVEGVVVKWLVEVGELVAKDQPLLEISTDKVDAEIPSPSAGRVAQILVKPGETVPIQAVLAKLETDPAAVGPAPEAPPKWDEETEGFPGHMARKTEPPIPAPPRIEPSAPPPPPPPTTGRIRITPVVARMASEHGLDLSKIPGTGIDGRVTRKDVEGYLASEALAKEARPSTPPPPPPRLRRAGPLSPRLRRVSPFRKPRPPSLKLRRAKPKGTRSCRGRRSGRGSRSTWSGASRPRPTSTSSPRWTCTGWRGFGPRRKRRA